MTFFFPGERETEKERERGGTRQIFYKENN
jgi:hypothetical protein